MINTVRFHVLTASMKMAIFRDVAPCSLLGGALMEAVSTFETSVRNHKTTWRNIPEDSNRGDIHL
jgi:hypothetical protein